VRIRSIKPEFWQSENVGRVSREARLLFIGLWSLADDSGRTRAASRFLASVLFPYDEDAHKRVPGWLAELEGAGCIRLYEAGGSHYLDIPHWADHQRIDRPTASRLPEYSRGLARAREGSTNTREGSTNPRENGADEHGQNELRRDSTNTREDSRGLDESSRGLVVGMEGKGKEGKGVGGDTPGPATPPPTPRFAPPTPEEVEAYCRERGKGVDAAKWLAHYTANGWKVGRNPMKDWRAAVRTWEQSATDAANRRPFA